MSPQSRQHALCVLVLNKNIRLVFSLVVRVALSIVFHTGFPEHRLGWGVACRKLTAECTVEVHLAGSEGAGLGGRRSYFSVETLADKHQREPEPSIDPGPETCRAPA